MTRIHTSSTSSTLTIHTSSLFNSRTASFDKNISIEVDPTTGLIVRVYQRAANSPISPSAHDIDLCRFTVLPGLVDAHTHIFLHSYSETPSIYQERDESFVERIVRATNHARSALRAGYTTYRDLGSEGLQDADVGFRDAINRGLIPGPRMFVVSEALASSGSYAIRHESRLNGTIVPRLADACDGVDGVTAAVRRRIGAGADVIKFYADYRRRQLRFPPQTWPGARPIAFPPAADARNPSSTMWTQAEMNAIVVEARRAGAPVAAHASTPEAVIMAATAGVTSVEHGFEPSAAAIEAMHAHKTIFVPTLSVIADGQNDEEDRRRFAGALQQTRDAFERGVRLAAGGDTGAFPHGENARELELLCQAGVPVEHVLRAATLGGWEACGGDACGRRFGCVKEGWAADLVAVEGDPRGAIEACRRVVFVMKDGRVYLHHDSYDPSRGIES